MSKVTRGTIDAGEAPVNPYSLLEAVNASSASVHLAWLFFIGVASYLLVVVAGVTHRDLLLAREIQLPILQSGIELSRAFLIAPFILVLFHAGLIAQLVTLARKAVELDRALRILEATDRRTHPLRLELSNFFFVQAISGPERSRLVGALLHGLSWLPLVVLPVAMLLYIQLAFLPYHSEAITAAHRVALVADVGLLALLGVFLTRPEASLGHAFSGAGRRHPLAMLVAVLLMAGATWFSFLVATIPGERLDRVSRALSGGGNDENAGGAPARHGFRVPFFGSPADGKLFSLFERNLNVAEQDLVVDKDVTPGEPTLDLRHRDLRYARLDRTDLHQADLTGANLNGASLRGADLRGAVLRCGDVSTPILNEGRATAACASARAANFAKARLSGANLSGLDLGGARLEGADLGGATLTRANLAGANLRGASLEKADLSGGTALQGANLGASRLQGADLTGARLQGADLTGAGLQGATLDFAAFDGATLRSADLEGASLYQARMPGADLTGARIRAASLREAWVWRAVVPEQAESDLADFSGLRLDRPGKAEIASLDVDLQRLADRPLETRLREVLARVLGGGDVEDERPGGSDSAWAELMRSSERATSDVGTVIGSLVPTGSVVSGEPVAAAPPVFNRGLAEQLRLSDRRARLTRHLAQMACKARWANGAVAAGVMRRALGPAFNGDPGVLLDSLRRPECAAAQSLPPDLIARLAIGVEALRAR